MAKEQVAHDEHPDEPQQPTAASPLGRGAHRSRHGSRAVDGDAVLARRGLDQLGADLEKPGREVTGGQRRRRRVEDGADPPVGQIAFDAVPGRDEDVALRHRQRDDDTAILTLAPGAPLGADTHREVGNRLALEAGHRDDDHRDTRLIEEITVESLHRLHGHGRQDRGEIVDGAAGARRKLDLSLEREDECPGQRHGKAESHPGSLPCGSATRSRVHRPSVPHARLLRRSMQFLRDLPSRPHGRTSDPVTFRREGAKVSNAVTY